MDWVITIMRRSNPKGTGQSTFSCILQLVNLMQSLHGAVLHSLAHQEAVKIALDSPGRVVMTGRMVKS